MYFVRVKGNACLQRHFHQFQRRGLLYRFDPCQGVVQILWGFWKFRRAGRVGFAWGFRVGRRLCFFRRVCILRLLRGFPIVYCFICFIAFVRVRYFGAFRGLRLAGGFLLGLGFIAFIGFRRFGFVLCWLLRLCRRFLAGILCWFGSLGYCRDRLRFFRFRFFGVNRKSQARHQCYR